jgi:glucose/arabinose dehydrogenase
MNSRLTSALTVVVACSAALFGCTDAVTDKSGSVETTAPASIPDSSVKAEALTTDLEAPTVVLGAADGTLLVAERAGNVRRIDPKNPDQSSTVLDITSDVGDLSGEKGLLGLATSPDEDELYVSYTRAADGASVIKTFPLGADGVAAASGREMLVVPQPFSNHNGGNLAVDADGLLWLGLGDGGAGGDPNGNGQNPATLLGSMLRVRPTLNGDEPYEIPDDNPFSAGTTPEGSKAAPEAWAFGLRNPWRFTFDSATGDLWIADVGQGEWEEINHVAADDGLGEGANFGWNRREGTHPYADSPDPADTPGDMVDPVFDYSHSDGRCSVTGGVVVRDAPGLPNLDGVYLWADLCEGRLHGLRTDADGEVTDLDLGAEVPGITSFGTAADGEVYAVSVDQNQLWRLTQKD